MEKKKSDTTSEQTTGVHAVRIGKQSYLTTRDDVADRYAEEEQPTQVPQKQEPVSAPSSLKTIPADLKIYDKIGNEELVQKLISGEYVLYTRHEVARDNVAEYTTYYITTPQALDNKPYFLGSPVFKNPVYHEERYEGGKVVETIYGRDADLTLLTTTKATYHPHGYILEEVITDHAAQTTTTKTYEDDLVHVVKETPKAVYAHTVQAGSTEPVVVTETPVQKKKKLPKFFQRSK